MDFSALYSLALSKGMMKNEMGLGVNRIPFSRRKLGKDFDYIFEGIRSKNPEIAKEAILDLTNLTAFAYVEEYPGFNTVVDDFLDNVDPAVRQAGMNLVASIEYRLRGEKRKSLMSMAIPRIRDIARNDTTNNLRTYATMLLCTFADKENIGTVLDLVEQESKNSYEVINPNNFLLRIMEKKMGHELRRQLYERLDKTEGEETKGRLKMILAGLRNLNWST